MKWFKIMLIAGACLSMTACSSTQENAAIETESQTEVADQDDVIDKDVYAITKGFWRLDGQENTATIRMNGRGDFEAYYADGTLEMSGYLVYDADRDDFEIYDPSDSYFSSFYFDSDTQIHFETEDEAIYMIVEPGESTAVQIPILMSGASFTGTTPLVTDNYEDGGYYYSFMTEDGMTEIINAALLNTIEDGQTMDDYIIDCVYDIGGDVVVEPAISQNDAFTETISYPVYVVDWGTGENEDQKVWKSFFFMTDTHTYTYTFSTYADNADTSLWEEEFSYLYLQ